MKNPKKQICNSSTFQLLGSNTQKWILEQNWQNFRYIQELVIPRILKTPGESPAKDFIISAPTATGKTEAVFLPICDILTLPGDECELGAEVLYICPLTALIDQQSDRLAGLFPEDTHPIIPWHGGSPQKGKQIFTEQPRGIVIITPESIESRFIHWPQEIKLYFGALKYIIIDELHAFFNCARGYQLLSQLNRLDYYLGRKIPRIALSATFNVDVQDEIKRNLRPENPDFVEFIIDDRSKREIEYEIHAYVNDFTPQKMREASCLRQEEKISAQIISDFNNLGIDPKTKEQRKGLLFVNSRQNAEYFTSELNQLSEEKGLGIQFLPHHGSLPKEIKQAAIEAINKPEQECVLVCTTTLELGIDIGTVHQVGQVDPGSSVSSLRQRLGRSGRKHGDVSKLIIYVKEIEGQRSSSILTNLHLPIFQAIAQISLVQQEEYEKPDERPAHLSTLIQQILSMIAQQGSVNIEEVRQILIETGPFVQLRRKIDPDGHLELLFDRLEYADLIKKNRWDSDEYFLTNKGKKTVGNYTFYPAFKTGTEYIIIGPQSVGYLGRIPIGFPYRVNDKIIFNGQRWLITSINHNPRVMHVVRTDAGQAPVFPGDPIPPSDKVISEMESIYLGKNPECISLSVDPSRLPCDLFLDFVDEGRQTFNSLNLADEKIINFGNRIVLFPWVAEREQTSLVYALQYHGLNASPAKIAIFVENTNLDQVYSVLRKLSSPETTDISSSMISVIPEGPEAARYAENLLIDKHDHFLSPYLQRWNYASFCLNMSSVSKLAQDLLDPT
jgi:ATP-dependent helicase Lhr and Lhr-like helicase